MYAQEVTKDTRNWFTKSWY